MYGQGQKGKQKRETKKLVEFHNHLNILTMSKRTPARLSNSPAQKLIPFQNDKNQVFSNQLFLFVNLFSGSPGSAAEIIIRGEYKIRGGTECQRKGFLQEKNLKSKVETLDRSKVPIDLDRRAQLLLT